MKSTNNMKLTDYIFQIMKKVNFNHFQLELTSTELSWAYQAASLLLSAVSTLLEI